MDNKNRQVSSTLQDRASSLQELESLRYLLNSKKILIKVRLVFPTYILG